MQRCISDLAVQKTYWQGTRPVRHSLAAWIWLPAIKQQNKVLKPSGFTQWSESCLSGRVFISSHSCPDIFLLLLSFLLYIHRIIESYCTFLGHDMKLCRLCYINNDRMAFSREKMQVLRQRWGYLGSKLQHPVCKLGLCQCLTQTLSKLSG